MNLNYLETSPNIHGCQIMVNLGGLIGFTFSGAPVKPSATNLHFRKLLLNFSFFQSPDTDRQHIQKKPLSNIQLLSLCIHHDFGCDVSFQGIQDQVDSWVKSDQRSVISKELFYVIVSTKKTMEFFKDFYHKPRPCPFILILS